MAVIRHKTAACISVLVVSFLCVFVCSRHPRHTRATFVADLVSISETIPHIATISVGTHALVARMATEADVRAIADLALTQHGIYRNHSIRVASVDFYVPGVSVVWARCIYKREGDDTTFVCSFNRNELSLPTQK